MHKLFAICLFVSFFAQVLSDCFTVTFQDFQVVEQKQRKRVTHEQSKYKPPVVRQQKLTQAQKDKVTKLAEDANTYLQKMDFDKLASSSGIAKSAFGEVQDPQRWQEIRDRFKALKSVSLRINGMLSSPMQAEDAGRVSRHSDPLQNYVLLYPRFFLPAENRDHIPDETLSLLLIQWALQQQYPLSEGARTLLYPNYLKCGYPKSESEATNSGFVSDVTALFGGDNSYKNAPSYVVALSLYMHMTMKSISASKLGLELAQKFCQQEYTKVMTRKG